MPRAVWVRRGPVIVVVLVTAALVRLALARRARRPAAPRDPTPDAWPADPRPATAAAPSGPPAIDGDGHQLTRRVRSFGRFRDFYGAHPLHLLALIASFALTGYAVAALVQAPNTLRIAIWFVAAVVVHDLVLFPLYALADRSTAWLLRRRSRGVAPVLNYVRAPALASALLLLVFFPAILSQGEATYARASGLQEGATYLTRWLLITGGCFLLSACCYSVRAFRHRLG